MAEPSSTSIAASVPSRCTACNEPLATPMVCGSCRTIFPASDQYDHFVRFGLPRGYSIEPQALEQRYLVLSRGLHPDQFAGRPKAERDLAERFSAHVNDAYHVLRHPLRRAEYLLELEGGPMRAHEKRTPPGFLAEMLELNEQIEEAKHGAIDDAKRAELRRLREDLAARRGAILDAMDPLFRALPPAHDPRRPAALSAIREKLNAAAYLEGLVTQLSELLFR